jgi:hypothetical protein
MTLITFQDGKVVLRDGQVGTEQGCCCGCTPCTCLESCVSYTFTFLGNLDNPDEPTDQNYRAVMEEDTCPENSPCFEFSALGEDGFPLYANGFGACSASDGIGDYVLGNSSGGLPYGRLKCVGDGFVFELCVFNICASGELPAGRLTKKGYSVTVGEDGCPTGIGGEVSSSTSDWYFDAVPGEWKPLSTYPGGAFDLDGEVPGSPINQRWCNQDCWGEWPFDFVVGTFDGFDCNPLP